MKIVVAVIIYDRFKNLEEWIRTWKLCDTIGAELIIIHNYKNMEERAKYSLYCHNNGVRYVPRKNVGLDIGAFQDVCRGRLVDFPNQWDYLFWVTDDVTPMSPTFLSRYLEEIQKPDIGVVCLELSKEVKLHVRTTAFMISKETANKITFSVPTIYNKAQCFDFEHRGKGAFYEQIVKMGKKAVQIHPTLKEAPLWDTHVRAHLARWPEHYKIFPK